MKRRIFSLISLAAYLAMTLTGFIVGISAILESRGGAESSGLGNAIVAVVLALVGILAVTYGALALIPTLLKLCDVIFRKRALTVTCIVFDVILLFLDVLLLVGTLAEPSNSVIGTILFSTLPIISLTFNILTMRSDKS